jgi:FdhE protein
MSVSAIKLIQPGEIQGMPDDDTPLLVVMPERHVFLDRAARLAHLSASQPESGWLKFCAQLAQAQVDAMDVLKSSEDGVRSSKASSSLNESVVQESFKHGMPPLSVSSWQPDTRWSTVLSVLTTAMKKQPLANGARAALDRLSALSLGEQQKQARAMLDAAEDQVSPDLAPYIGATLQLLWVHDAQAVKAFTHLHKGENGLCPVCGSHPVSSVLRVGDRDGHRYLVCSLCASEWYAPRARCTNCDTPKEVSRLGETGESLVQGECCDDCGGYIKIMFQSKDPQMDPVADDLATLSLDLAMASEGYQRTGRNLFFVTGQTESSAREPSSQHQ